MEILALVGLISGILVVFMGQVLEGGQLAQIFQPTAALIVFGGTLGATLLSFPSRDIWRALSSIPFIFIKSDNDPRPVIEEIVRIAAMARKEGVLAVEGQRETIRDPFFRRAMKFVVDGFEPRTVQEIIETEMKLEREGDEAAARVWEVAGGYAPTVGIVGAVLGLIQVMNQLDDPSKIGSGIAAAFVASLYGIATAHFVLIPWGTKLRRLAQLNLKSKELVRLGIAGIQEGLNPSFLQQKLAAHLEPELQASMDRTSSEGS